MKKTLIALLALTGMSYGAVYTGAPTITLDSCYGDSTTSLYQHLLDGGSVQKNGTNVGNGTIEYFAPEGDVASINFYINVNDLFGAASLKDGWTYYINTFSFLKKDEQYYTGGSRTLTLSNGTNSVTFAQDQVNNKWAKTDFQEQITDDNGLELLSFKKGDMITITLTTGVGPADESKRERISAQYYDINSPGVSFTLHNGKVNDGDDYTKNPGTTSWKYNSPVIRLTAYAVPEPTTATLSLLALAGLAARRRRK